MIMFQLLWWVPGTQRQVKGSLHPQETHGLKEHQIIEEAIMGGAPKMF